MTRYAVDLRRRELIASWGTGVGEVAEVVTAIAPAADDAAALAVASRLSELCAQAWRTYTHPASAADSLEPNTEGWRREQDSKALGEVLEAVRAPNLPHDGMIEQSYIPVEEAAHRLGRALDRIGDADLLERVAGEVADELAAVEQAELGDLSGRARQAVLLTRADASPVQVMAADAILREDPLGSDRLLTEVDPTSAAVAAGHWLAAAASVAAEVSETEFTEVIVEADNIEALADVAPTLILQAIEVGVSPREAVITLIAEAMRAAAGEIPNLTLLLEQVANAMPDVDGLGDRDLAGALVSELMPKRTTPLDPTQPARDLLVDLLGGIRGCWLLYTAHDDGPHGDDDQLTDEFVQLVRDRAAEAGERLS